jgi:phenylalanyl-tRNA synthetase beta chain
MTPVIQDLALVVDGKVHASEVMAAVRNGAGPLLEDISLFDRYDKLEGGKVSLAFTLTFRAADRTLTTEEVAVHRDAAVAKAAELCGASLRA